MEKPEYKEYKLAQEEMKRYRKTVDPLVALFLLDDYGHQELLESVITKLPVEVIEKVDIRFHLIDQLIQLQKVRVQHPTEFPNFSVKEVRSNKKYCDFKEVMEILGRSRTKVESLIDERKIRPLPDKPKAKRRFLKEEIIRYAEGLS